MGFLSDLACLPIPFVSFVVVILFGWLGYKIRVHDKDIYIEMLEIDNKALRKNYSLYDEERD